jgi:hypothetical protein
MVEDAGYQLPASLAELDTLNPFAVTFRYEKDALVVNKEQAGNLMEQLREWVEAQVTGQPAHAAEESEHG